jgi:hypothetical protein
MKKRTIAVTFLAGALAGCMAGGAPGDAQSPADPRASFPPAAPSGASRLPGTPLLIDRTDLRIGTTVQFGRIPTTGEVHDATQVAGLAHIVLALPDWPADFEPLQALDQTPPEADVVVVLPGYPPTRAAAQAWNYLRVRQRIIVVVPGPPPGPSVISDLNSMRGLERVVAHMDDPSREGFELLQRPLSFRKIVP